MPIKLENIPNQNITINEVNISTYSYKLFTLNTTITLIQITT